MIINQCIICYLSIYTKVCKYSRCLPICNNKRLAILYTSKYLFVFEPLRVNLDHTNELYAILIKKPSFYNNDFYIDIGVKYLYLFSDLSQFLFRLCLNHLHVDLTSTFFFCLSSPGIQISKSF